MGSSARTGPASAQCPFQDRALGYARAAITTLAPGPVAAAPESALARHFKRAQPTRSEAALDPCLCRSRSRAFMDCLSDFTLTDAPDLQNALHMATAELTTRIRNHLGTT